VFDGSFLLWEDFPIVDAIHLKGNKLVMGVKSKAADDSILNDSPEDDDISLCCITLNRPYCM